MNHPHTGPRTILIVDDESDVLLSLKTLFEEWLPSTRVLTSTSGELALEILHREDIDLLVTDYRMPRMTGLELLFESRRVYPQVPRILMTAYQVDLSNADILQAGIVSLLTKPFDLSDVRGAVERGLRAST